MKQIYLSGKKVLLVPIPKGAKTNLFGRNLLVSWFLPGSDDPVIEGRITPKGFWTILGKGDEVTDPEIIEAIEREGMDKETTLILTAKK